MSLVAPAGTTFRGVIVKTSGDASQDRPFEQIGPKGVFCAEIQRALASGELDLAVHSLKDLEAREPDALELVAILERADPRDVLVSASGVQLEGLPANAIVGTSSDRRRALLLSMRPDLRIGPLRGNVDTRLAKVARGDVAAAVLAAAGLARLGRLDAVTQWLDPSVFVPAPGQGAIAVEARKGELGWARAADHAPTRRAVEAERAFMESVEGGCRVPLGAWAREEGGALACDAFVASRDGSRIAREHIEGAGEPEELGRALADRIRESGGASILESLRDS
jgi:hydroxymethylbilane synthase